MINIILALFIENINNLLIIVIAFYMITPFYMRGILLLINPLFERRNQIFIEQSKEKLKRIDPIRIGITGSYGKTSCKNILEHLLGTSFSVYATEKNYNTPMGIAISIDKMQEDTQIFIAEMGARKVGDIAELCDIVEPDYGIITGVCNQHLETFGTIDNIYEEKYNLARYLESKSLCVFNGADKYSLKMYKQFRGKKYIVRQNNFADLYATDIDISSEGSIFTIKYKDERLICQTELLGRHNIQNILLCSAIALELGVSTLKLVDRIRTLKMVPHRLQLIKSNGINILDDSYNANILGIKYSLECLGYFDTRKVVLTQGMVELGDEQAQTNILVGKLIASVADLVIICGINAKDILKGIEEEGYNNKVKIYSTIKDAQADFKNLLKKGDTLLIQNDLPDIY
jgi:UDP-N-acetylmuramoyl-tripeptide--D-alanyl-D-alanine ligase